MSEFANAPQADSSATALADPVVTAASSEQPSSLDSTEAIVDRLAKHFPDNQSEAEPQGSQPAETGAEENQEGPEKQEADTDVQQIKNMEAPASWGAEAKELFAKLPTELQQQVSQRETQRETAVHAYSRQAAEARQREGALLQYVHQELGQALNAAQVAVDGEFANINWNELKAKDPQLYLQIEAMYEQRIANLEKVKSQFQAIEQAKAQQARQFEAQRIVGEAHSSLQPLAKIVGDGFNPKTWKDEAAKFLSGMGAPIEHINGVTHGYQLQLIAKAMLYDKLQANAAQAQQKLAAAPKVMKQEGAPVVELETAKKKAAYDKLRQNPKDNSAIVAALRASSA